MSDHLKLGVGLWVLYGLIVGTLVAIQPDKRTVTTEYRQASEKWWVASESLYDLRIAGAGYLYLPQAAILYTPYQVLPKRVGEPLWRLTCLALLAAGLWRVAGLMDPERQSSVFLGATLMVIPAALSSARNGQVNLPLAGLLLLSVADLSKCRWNLATLWLLLSIMLKPIALAPALLAAACYAPLRLRLIGGFLLCLAAAFIHPSTEYVVREYHRFWMNCLLAGQPGNPYSEFFGMLWMAHLHPHQPVITALRALAAGATLFLSLQVMKRFRGQPSLQAFGVMFLAALFLMLFKPRTEENSYVILAGFTALLAARDLVLKETRRGIWLAVFCLFLAVENFGPIYQLTRIWFKPLLTVGLVTVLLSGRFKLLQPRPVSETARGA